MNELFIHVWLVVQPTSEQAKLEIELASIKFSEKENLISVCSSNLPEASIWAYKPSCLVMWVDEVEKHTQPIPRAKWQVVCGDCARIEAVLNRPIRNLTIVAV